MRKKLTKAIDVYETRNNQLVARISLNGYDIEAGGLFPNSGAMRSFIMVDGDLWEQWNAVETLLLKNQQGASVSARIAALPVEEDGFGLIEFL
jgi:predicted NUDIX family NTP pyrophosphohydrolase